MKIRKYTSIVQKKNIRSIIFAIIFILSVLNIFSFIYLDSKTNISEISISSANDEEEPQIYDPNSELFIFVCDTSGMTASLEGDFDLVLFGLTSLGSVFIIEFAVITRKISKEGCDISDSYEEDYVIQDTSIIGDESIVFDTIKEYLDANRCFEKDKIIGYIIARFAKDNININGVGIRANLEVLLENNMVVEGSKMTKEDVLENSNRSQVYNYIKDNPGAYPNKIVNALGMSTFLVNWHLEMLLKFNYVRSERIDNMDAYFDSEMNPEYDEINHLISREKCNKIVEYLKNSVEGVTKYQLSKDLGMHANTITKYLNKIESFGLIMVEKLSNKRLYFLDDVSYSILIQN